MTDTLEPYDSWRDTPHPFVETWAQEWAGAIYTGTDQAWIQRIELARLALRERAASVRAAEETPKPHRAYTITLRVGGDTWHDALRMFEEYVEIVRERKPEEVNVTTGGPVNGGYVHVDIDTDMTHERYIETLNVYLGKAARSSGARGGAS